MKKIVPSTWDFGENKVTLLGDSGSICKDGICRLVKQAGYIFKSAVQNWKPDPGEVPVHVVIVGSTEFYGPNRNGDGFREETCKKYHDTFVKHARFYRNHDHHNPARSYGVVKFSAYNPRMHRIELIGVLNGTKEAAERNGGLVADREIELIKSGKDMAVSMSCIVEKDAPVLTKRGYIDISQVSVGDMVMTHAGRWRKVTKTMNREYEGKLVRTIINSGWPKIITFTEEHPLYVTRIPKKAIKDVVFGRTKIDFWWEEAKNLDNDHVVHMPIFKPLVHRPYELEESFITLLAASQICGSNRSTWVEEGHLRLYFENPEITAEVMSAISDLKTGASVDTRADGHRDVVEIEDPELISMLIETLDGDLNRFPHHYLGYGENIISTLCARYLSYAPKRETLFNEYQAIDYVSITLPSRDVVLGLKNALNSLGIPTVIDEHIRGQKSYWFLHFWAGHVSSAIGFVRGVPFNPDIENYYPLITDDGISLVHRVKKARAVELDEPIMVYNLEVEEDESYMVAGYSTHNCTVSHDICSGCGNKAKSRAEYCGPEKCPRGGLRYNMGRLFKDGHVLHADNPDPKFFDVSYVYRPADRAAYVLGPIDSSAVKLAADARNLRTLPVFGHISRDMVARYRHILEKVAASGWCPEIAGIENKPLPDHIVFKYDPHTIIKYSMDNGLLLPPVAFAGVLGGNDILSVMPEVKTEAETVYRNFSSLCKTALFDGLYEIAPLMKSAAKVRLEGTDREFFERNYSLHPIMVMNRLANVNVTKIEPISGVKMGIDTGRLTDFARRYISYAVTTLNNSQSFEK